MPPLILCIDTMQNHSRLYTRPTYLIGTQRWEDMEEGRLVIEKEESQNISIAPLCAQRSR